MSAKNTDPVPIFSATNHSIGLICLSFSIGVCAIQLSPVLPPLALFPVFLLLAGLLLPSKTASRYLSLLLLGLLWSWMFAEFRLNQTLPEALVGKDLEVSGQVMGIPQDRQQGRRFLFSIDDSPEHDFSGLVRLSWYRQAPVVVSTMKNGCFPEAYWRLVMSGIRLTINA